MTARQKLTGAMKVDIYCRLDRGESLRRIAEEYGITTAQVREIWRQVDGAAIGDRRGYHPTRAKR